LFIDSIEAQDFYFRGNIKLKQVNTLSACEEKHTSVNLGYKDADSALFFNCK